MRANGDACWALTTNSGESPKDTSPSFCPSCSPPTAAAAATEGEAAPPPCAAACCGCGTGCARAIRRIPRFSARLQSEDSQLGESAARDSGCGEGRGGKASVKTSDIIGGRKHLAARAACAVDLRCLLSTASPPLLVAALLSLSARRQAACAGCQQQQQAHRASSKEVSVARGGALNRPAAAQGG